MISRAIARWLDRVDPDKRRIYASRLLMGTLVAHVLSHVLLVWLRTLAPVPSAEVFFEHVMLLISFGAIEITCVDVILTADVRANE